MASGIGAYYSPNPVRPVNPTPPGAGPARATSGVGAYYGTSPFAPVPPAPRGAQPLRPTSGLGFLTGGQQAAFILLALLVVGAYAMSRTRYE